MEIRDMFKTLIETEIKEDDRPAEISVTSTERYNGKQELVAQLPKTYTVKGKNKLSGFTIITVTPEEDLTTVSVRITPDRNGLGYRFSILAGELSEERFNKVLNVQLARRQQNLKRIDSQFLSVTHYDPIAL